MPPKTGSKSPVKSRTASPPKAPAAKGAPAKKPAGSAQLAAQAGPAPSAGGKNATTGATSTASSTLIKFASNDAACVFLQSLGRAYLERLTLGTDHKKALAKKMEKEAEDRIFAHSRKERQLRESQKKVQQEEESKEKKKIAQLEALSVASFEGNLAEIKKLIAAGVDLHGKDQQGNNCVGEAAVGGQTACVAFLLDQGGNPNVAGEYGRTPLWRAAFNSHTETMKLLLERGADPRTRAQGQTPDEICSDEGKALLAGWDISKTDTMVASYQKKLNDIMEKRKAEAQAVSASLTSSADDLKGRLDAKKKKLVHHKMEFEKRIVEYDLVNNDPSKERDLVKVALDSVKTAEKDVESTQTAVDALHQEYVALRTRIALHNHEELGEELEGTEFPFKKLADVVFDDTDKLWTASGKWPLIIDVSGRSRTFLKYRNVIFVDTFNSNQMQPDSLRKSVLGALRFGKPLVFDLHDVPMVESIRESMKRVHADLFQNVVSQTIKTPAIYRALLRQPADGPEYEEGKFTPLNVEASKIVFVSSAFGLEEGTGDLFALLRVEQ